jgi:hypothetical protein
MKVERSAISGVSVEQGQMFAQAAVAARTPEIDPRTARTQAKHRSSAWQSF